LLLKKMWLFSAAFLMALGIAAAQSPRSSTQNPASGSTGGSSSTAPSQSSTTTGGADANGRNQSVTSQTDAMGTSGNTSAVGSKSANGSTPSPSAQSATGAGANHAYPTDQNSATGNDQIGAEGTATGASTGVGVSADPRKNKVQKSELPQIDQGNSNSDTTAVPTKPH
jgi:hypothetical protein